MHSPRQATIANLGGGRIAVAFQATTSIEGANDQHVRFTTSSDSGMCYNGNLHTELRASPGFNCGAVSARLTCNDRCYIPSCFISFLRHLVGTVAGCSRRPIRKGAGKYCNEGRRVDESFFFLRIAHSHCADI